MWGYVRTILALSLLICINNVMYSLAQMETSVVKTTVITATPTTASSTELPEPTNPETPAPPTTKEPATPPPALPPSTTLPLTAPAPTTTAPITPNPTVQPAATISVPGTNEPTTAVETSTPVTRSPLQTEPVTKKTSPTPTPKLNSTTSPGTRSPQFINPISDSSQAQYQPTKKANDTLEPKVQNTSSNNEGLSTMSIIVIIAGAIISVAIILFVILYALKLRRQRDSDYEGSDAQPKTLLRDPTHSISHREHYPNAPVFLAPKRNIPVSQDLSTMPAQIDNNVFNSTRSTMLMTTDSYRSNECVDIDDISVHPSTYIGNSEKRNPYSRTSQILEFRDSDTSSISGSISSSKYHQSYSREHDRIDSNNGNNSHYLIHDDRQSFAI